MNRSPACIGPDEELWLREEHAALERQLAEVLHLATSNDWPACALIWELLSRELELHIRHEEKLIFPTFAQSGLTASRWTEQFRSDHAEIRRECRALGCEPLPASLSLAHLHRFISTVLAHRECESLVLSPWLASVAPQRLSWGMRLIAGDR